MILSAPFFESSQSVCSYIFWSCIGGKIPQNLRSNEQNSACQVGLFSVSKILNLFWYSTRCIIATVNGAITPFSWITRFGVFLDDMISVWRKKAINSKRNEQKTAFQFWLFSVSKILNWFWYSNRCIITTIRDALIPCYGSSYELCDWVLWSWLVR